MRRSGFQPRKKPIQRGRKKSYSKDAAVSARFWRERVVAGGCAMCRAYPVSPVIEAEHWAALRWIQGHHILPKRHLRHGYVGSLWDVRNGLGLCAYHHERHEKYTQRVPRHLLNIYAVEFAEELGLVWLLDREYPTEMEDAA